MALPLPATPALRTDPLEMGFLRHFGLPGDVLEALTRRYGPVLLPIQAQAVQAGLFERKNLLICGPTSCGKTLVGELACIHHALHGRAALFLVPTRALANEKFSTLRDTYEPLGYRVLLSTGDCRTDDTRLVSGRFHVAVVVYEKLMALLVEHPGLVAHLGVVVFDELQVLHDEERGHRIELLATRLRGLPGLQRIGLSAVGVCSQFAAWSGAFTVRDPRRPVSLRQGVLHDGVFYYRDQATGEEGSERLLERSAMNDREAILDAALTLASRDEQTLVFLPTKWAVNAWAVEAAGKSQLPSAPSALDELSDAPETEAVALLKATLPRGVAVHHGDLPYFLRQLVERYLAEGQIGLVFATSTLAEGVNLPAVNTLVYRDVLATKAEDAARGLPPQPVRLAPAQFHSMTGRSGRLGRMGKTACGVARGMVVAEDRADVGALFRHYLDGPFHDAQPLLWRRPLGETVLTLLAEDAAQTTEEIAERLGQTLSASTGLLPMENVQLRRVLDDLLAHDLVRAEHGQWQLSAIGRIVAAFGVAPETVRAFDNALGWYDAHTSVLECVLVLAATHDGQRIYLPLSRTEREEHGPLRELEQRAVERGLERAPAVQPLLVTDCRLPALVATAKKGLVVDDWLSLAPTEEIERRYRLWGGAISRIAQRLAWLAQAWLSLGRLRGADPAACRKLERLSAAMGTDTPMQATALAGLAGCGLDRSHILQLWNEGIRNLSAVQEVARCGSLPGFSKPLQEQLLRHLLRTQGHQAARSRTTAVPTPAPPSSAGKVCDARHTVSAEVSLTLRLDGAYPHRVFLGSAQVPCTPTERRVLEIAARARGSVVPWETLLDAIWGNRNVGQEAVYRHKSSINRKVRQATGGRVDSLLVAVPRLGIQLHEAVTVATSGMTGGK